MNSLPTKRVGKIREAYDAGLSIRATAAKCEVPRTTVERYWRRWQASDFGGEITGRVSGATKTAWKTEADRRDISLHALVAHALERIAEDDLFAEVLDDEAAE